MIRVPLYLAVAQWALLLALGVLVVLMYRQLGRVLSRDAKRPQLGPAAGSRAVTLPYTRAGDDHEHVLRPRRWQARAAGLRRSDLPVVRGLVTVLGTAQDAGELSGLRVLLLVSDPPAYLDISAAFRATKLEIGRPSDRDALAAYRASGTPLLVAIDGAGLVRAAASVIRRAEVQAFARACLLPDPLAVPARPAPPARIARPGRRRPSSLNRARRRKRGGPMSWTGLGGSLDARVGALAEAGHAADQPPGCAARRGGGRDGRAGRADPRRAPCARREL